MQNPACSGVCRRQVFARLLTAPPCHPSVRSGYVNPDAKKLMLAHAFASGARRVELLTDLRNAWSQAAIAKLGAIREGVLRRDRKTWTGHIRDTVVFSLTDLDWPKVSQRLNMRL